MVSFRDGVDGGRAVELEHLGGGAVEAPEEEGAVRARDDVLAARARVDAGDRITRRVESTWYSVRPSGLQAGPLEQMIPPNAADTVVSGRKQ